MKILGIDPGSTDSAYVLWDGERILDKGKFPNPEMAYMLRGPLDARLYIEMIGHYGTGMPAGKTVFDTCVWIGRFIECWEKFDEYELILRPTVKTHLCGSARAKDGNVRAALIDRLGAPGTKANPGRTYGVSADVWQALAVAVCAYDRLACGMAK